MHRFVWDLHGEPPKSLNKEFPISAIVHDTPLLPLGAWALPGNLYGQVDGGRQAVHPNR